MDDAKKQIDVLSDETLVETLQQLYNVRVRNPKIEIISLNCLY